MADPENLDFTLEDHIAGEVGERVRAVISAAESTAAVIRREAEQEAQARKRLAESERARYLEQARQDVDQLVRERVARLNELSDALIEGAERLLSELGDAQRLRGQLDRVVGSLADAAEELTTESRASLTAATRRRPAVDPEPERRTAPEPAAARPEPVPEPEPEPVEEEPEIEAVEEEPITEASSPAEADAELHDDEDDRDEEPAPRRLRPIAAVPNGDSGERAREQDDDTLAARLVALQMAVAGSPRGEVEEHLRVTFALDDTTSILNDVFGTEAPPFAR